ncbi:hypothetical protein [Marinifilum caeruleilacunae]|uniref:Uncharacterized protein n=1 Tax=Marinifilum caeruleilacunae TaxID=2499076 RepID=A0ABX1WTF6_9BACT|nr:hypothetical protein [Marinifilum caeruleilacunae]NOU59381.1 hypothetical protein [Marinifilum caeruleilacunae]
MKGINKLLLAIGILLISTTAFCQNTENHTIPKKDIKVNKEYDEDGNLIRYDSTYVYSWSSDSTHHFFSDSAFLNKMDMSRMHKRMQEQLSRFFGPDSLRKQNNRHPFFSDDFFKDDFFDRDFFDSSMFPRNFHQRDSSQNDFFKELEEMMKNRRQFRQQHSNEMQRELDSLRRDFLDQRRKYYQQRDSIYRKHRGMQSNTVDL